MRLKRGVFLLIEEHIARGYLNVTLKAMRSAALCPREGSNAFVILYGVT